MIPYLLHASPVISAGRLQDIYRDLERGISSIVLTTSLVKDYDDPANYSRNEEIAARTSEVLQQLDRLNLIHVDMSVLTVTDMPSKMKALSNRKGLDHQPKVTANIKAILKKWKASIKGDNKESTIRDLKGGNVITAKKALARGDDMQQAPLTVPSALWKVLSRTHNETQLLAIKYVVSSMKIGGKESGENDTRICLIQGPPGNCYIYHSTISLLRLF